VINVQAATRSRFRCFPAGDLDQQAATRLRRVIGPVLRPGLDVIVDLRHVESMDAAGVGALADFLRLVRTLGGTARVCHARPRLRWRLELVGIEGPALGASVPPYYGVA
jgi:anti-anti-sigma factor